MTATKPFLALSAAGLLLLGGCGGSSTTASSPSVDQLDSDVGDSSTGPSGPGAGNAADVDVCSLLSQDDAAAVARAQGLNGAQTDATVYTLTATPEPDTGGAASCKFHIDGQGAEGTVVIQVQSAKSFGIYKTGTKVPGVGDEAYKSQGTTVVRVGDHMLSAGENSFNDDFVVDLYRKMAPHLK